MEPKNNLPELSPEEKLKAENDLLKLKLTAEFGMQSGESSLNDEAENEWLNYIYNYEKAFSEAKRIKVYDFLGKPEFKKIDSLNKNEIEHELDRLFEIMNQNNISLDCICEYEDEVIYKFITEELFEQETDDMRIDGMTHCYIYEEFYPNHEYDLRCLANEFFEDFFEKDWNEICAEHQLDENMIFNKKNLTREDFVKILFEFREFNRPFKRHSNCINELEFNIETKTATIKGYISYETKTNQPDILNYSGNYFLRFKYNDYYWGISEIIFPGFE